jgi:hypothetical protein
MLQQMHFWIVDLVILFRSLSAFRVRGKIRLKKLLVIKKRWDVNYKCSNNAR